MRNRIKFGCMNIQQLLTEISDKGKTDQEIAERIGVKQPTVTRLRNGVHKSTSFECGTAIAALHKELVLVDPGEQQEKEKVA